MESINQPVRKSVVEGKSTVPPVTSRCTHQDPPKTAKNLGGGSSLFSVEPLLRKCKGAGAFETTTRFTIWLKPGKVTITKLGRTSTDYRPAGIFQQTLSC